METFWFFSLQLHRAYDSAYDSDFDFHKVRRSLTTPTPTPSLVKASPIWPIYFQWYPLPKLWHVVYLWLFYDISISWLNLSNGKRFYFSLAWYWIKLPCVTWKPLIGQLNFITSKQTPAPPRKSTPDLQSVQIVTLFKKQKSADSVRKQFKDLGKLLNIDLRPVFISRKVGEDLNHKEIKPALINEQSVVYKFECGWCDASYLGSRVGISRASLPTNWWA